jgi:hypothetical protein
MPHTWRTRPDPFADVWGLVQLQVDINPSRTAKELFIELQHRYPGKFSDGQLRTLQRRVKQHRREQLSLKQVAMGSWSPSIPVSIVKKELAEMS